MNHRGTETQRDPLTEAVIGCAIEVHRQLGPGLLESAYESCLAWELEQQAIPFRRQISLPVQYKQIVMEIGYRIDLMVNNQLIIEVKAVEKLLPVHDAQLLTYMKLADVHTGLLLNFHTAVLKDGIKRLKL